MAPHHIILILLLLLTALDCQRPHPFTTGRVRTGSYDSRREEMVRQQIAGRGVTDPGVLRAMRTVQRHLFVPPEVRDLAYEDSPLPIGHEQTISQPYVVALMTAALQPRKGQKILEVGTGSGYQAAVLAEIVDSVFTIEILAPLADTAGARLRTLHYTNVVVRRGDGYAGWPDHAPYDGIIVTAAPPRIPQPLIDQLKEGGRMIIPTGEAEDMQELTLVQKKEGKIVTEKQGLVRFVPLIRDN